MILIARPENVDECLRVLRDRGDSPTVIGSLRPLPQKGCEQVEVISPSGQNMQVQATIADVSTSEAYAAAGVDIEAGTSSISVPFLNQIQNREEEMLLVKVCPVSSVPYVNVKICPPIVSLIFISLVNRYKSS